MTHKKTSPNVISRNVYPLFTEENKTLKQRSGKVDDATRDAMIRSESYQSWLRKQEDTYQDTLLGPENGRLFRSGDVGVSWFFDNRGKRFTISKVHDRLTVRGAKA